MSNMASCIGEFSILCTKNADMLLFATNIGIAYECCLYAGTWHIRSLYLLLLHMGTAISTIICYKPVYKQHLYAMPIFVINNNISAVFVHKIENFLIQLYLTYFDHILGDFLC